MWKEAGTETTASMASVHIAAECALPASERSSPFKTGKHACARERNGLSRGSVVNMTESVQNQVYIAHFFREINTHTQNSKTESHCTRVRQCLGSVQRAHTVRAGHEPLAVWAIKIMLTQILQVSLD